ncbi:MAG TPA: heme NO-binding domain-containing protein [Solirubrobacteraceae bacterium]|nr:heme NO-binding domain-containing protein [Solirubrobacteraceae bacterium]
MKGIVFNAFEEMIVGEHGEDAWDDLLDQAGLEGAYTSVGSYPYEELLALVGAAEHVYGVPADDLVRALGRSAIPLFAARFPAIFEPYHDARSLVLCLNEIIHAEVRKLYPGADVPTFDYEFPGPNVVLMGYRSKRKLCTLGEGLVEGTAHYYGETVSIEQPTCMRRGDPRCTLAIRFGA